MAGAYTVAIKRKVERSIARLPKNVQKTFGLLIEDLRETGPIQRAWSNFSALGEGRYHCHLMGSYVAGWTCEKGRPRIEVYYAGSREGAPY